MGAGQILKVELRQVSEIPTPCLPELRLSAMARRSGEVMPWRI